MGRCRIDARRTSLYYAPIYPFLFAVVPVLRIAAAYPGWAELADVAIVTAATLTACALAYGLVLLATRRRSRLLAPLILLGGVAAFWIYPRVAPFMERSTGATHPVLLPLWAAATAGVVWWLGRRPARLDQAGRFLTLTAAILVGWFTLSIGAAQARSGWALRQSALVRRLAEPIPVRPDAAAGPKPDIYLIVLDEYANADVTGRLFGFDNRAFLDSLRQLGFVVPAVHSNYLQTFLSLPSILNAAHLAELSGELGDETVDRTVPDHLTEHNRIVPFLQSRGYRFAFFPSLSWDATRQNPWADSTYDVLPAWSAAREVSRSDFRQALVKTSLLRYVEWETSPLVRAHVAGTLDAVAQVAEIPGPVFTFAHLMSPHSPYVSDRNCNPAPPLPRGMAGKARVRYEAGAYIEQIQCLNRMLLGLVTALLRTSEIPPVILLQGDHGSKTLRYDKAPTAGDITPGAARERLGAFGAYYLPGRGAEAFGDSVTVVNVMGNVLRSYLGAALPRQADDMYLSVDDAPYAFRRVDYGWLADEGGKAVGR